MDTQTNDTQDTTLRGILRLNINQAHDGNKFWLVDKWENICVDHDSHNELLTTADIMDGINSGRTETEQRKKQYEILVSESEFFRIVEKLNPNCVKNDGRGYKFISDIVELKIGRNGNMYKTFFSDEAKEKNEDGII